MILQFKKEHLLFQLVEQQEVDKYKTWFHQKEPLIFVNPHPPASKILISQNLTVETTQE